jgi:hypothetical protein
MTQLEIREEIETILFNLETLEDNSLAIYLLKNLIKELKE